MRRRASAGGAPAPRRPAAAHRVRRRASAGVDRRDGIIDYACLSIIKDYGSLRKARPEQMRYEAPEAVEGAVALLSAATGEARVLAGGTDLLVQMRADVVEPDLIVDIKKIAETRAITEEKGGWRIGAAVTGAELKEHARLKKAWPGVVEAANLIGSTQVQGRATLGGNLCNGSPAADSVPALIAAGAVATLAGPQGARDLPVEDVMLGPRKLALRKGEFLVSFLLPPRPKGSSDAYLRFIPRTEMDIAVVGAGVSVTLDGRLVCACLVRGCEVGGRRIETIEGMAEGESLHPLQQKFLEHAALQCGICTPGFLVASKALLERKSDPTETEIRYWMAGNLCRCTGYDKIVTAVMDAAATLRRG